LLQYINENAVSAVVNEAIRFNISTGSWSRVNVVAGETIFKLNVESLF